MRVLLIHNYYRSTAPSGEDAVFENERRMLQENGIEVFTFERCNDDIDESTFGKKIRAALNGAWSRQSYENISREVRRIRPNVVHFHNIFALVSPSAWLACKEEGVAVVQTLHNYRFVCPAALLFRAGKPCEDCLGSSLLPALLHRCYRGSVLATAAQAWMIQSNRLKRSFRNNVDFFKTLESTYISKLIDELIIRVKKQGIDDSVEFAELSEGEQQLLTVLGLLRFTKEEESLFLLDEPDTHLNPAWKYEYIDLLNEVVGQNETSHIIIVTHDPLVIGGLRKEQVRVFTVRDSDKRIFAHQPTLDPIGMGVAGLLTSELFDLPTTIDRETQKKLDRKKELTIKPKSERSMAEEKELENLNAEIEAMGFMTAFRDPLYTRYLKALKKYELSEKPVLTEEDRKKQSELDKEIIRKLKGVQP